ncbi:hypothetical protein GGR58DRAFT_499981 [Xylaria digitata]|nr:hypothetical protein GGR58DRAFT_499981 [Xylaria digitata]
MAGEVLSQWKELAGLSGEYCYQYKGQQAQEAFWRTVLMDEGLDLFSELGRVVNGGESDLIPRRHRMPPDAEFDWLPQFSLSDADDLEAIKLAAGRMGTMFSRQGSSHVILEVTSLTVLSFSYVNGIMDGEVIHQPRIEEFQDLRVETFIIG